MRHRRQLAMSDECLNAEYQTSPVIEDEPRPLEFHRHREKNIRGHDYLLGDQAELASAVNRLVACRRLDEKIFQPIEPLQEAVWADATRKIVALMAS